MMEEYFNTLLQETERRMAAASAGMEGKETVATCREMVSYLKAKNRELKAYALARPFSGNEEEIRYFKYYKPPTPRGAWCEAAPHGRQVRGKRK